MINFDVKVITKKAWQAEFIKKFSPTGFFKDYTDIYNEFFDNDHG